LATKTIQIPKIVHQFIEELKKNISIEKVILFGSYVKNKRKKWSDIDLAIISNDFEGVDYFDRLVMLGKYAWQAKATAIEALGFTPGEYRKITPLDFLSEIEKTGKIIYKKKQKCLNLSPNFIKKIKK